MVEWVCAFHRDINPICKLICPPCHDENQSHLISWFTEKSNHKHPSSLALDLDIFTRKAGTITKTLCIHSIEYSNAIKPAVDWIGWRNSAGNRPLIKPNIIISLWQVRAGGPCQFWRYNKVFFCFFRRGDPIIFYRKNATATTTRRRRRREALIFPHFSPHSTEFTPELFPCGLEWVIGAIFLDQCSKPRVISHFTQSNTTSVWVFWFHQSLSNPITPLCSMHSTRWFFFHLIFLVLTNMTLARVISSKFWHLQQH